MSHNLSENKLSEILRNMTEEELEKAKDLLLETRIRLYEDEKSALSVEHSRVSPCLLSESSILFETKKGEEKEIHLLGPTILSKEDYEKCKCWLPSFKKEDLLLFKKNWETLHQNKLGMVQHLERYNLMKCLVLSDDQNVPLKNGEKFFLDGMMYTVCDTHFLICEYCFYGGVTNLALAKYVLDGWYQNLKTEHQVKEA